MISPVSPIWPAEIYLSAHLSSSAQPFLLTPSSLFTETRHEKCNRGRHLLVSWGPGKSPELACGVRLCQETRSEKRTPSPIEQNFGVSSQQKAQKMDYRRIRQH